MRLSAGGTSLGQLVLLFALGFCTSEEPYVKAYLAQRCNEVVSLRPGYLVHGRGAARADASPGRAGLLWKHSPEPKP